MVDADDGYLTQHDGRILQTVAITGGDTGNPQNQDASDQTQTDTNDDEPEQLPGYFWKDREYEYQDFMKSKQGFVYEVYDESQCM